MAESAEIFTSHYASSAELKSAHPLTSPTPPKPFASQDIPQPDPEALNPEAPTLTTRLIKSKPQGLRRPDACSHQ